MSNDTCQAFFKSGSWLPAFPEWFPRDEKKSGPAKCGSVLQPGIKKLIVRVLYLEHHPPEGPPDAVDSWARERGVDLTRISVYQDPAFPEVGAFEALIVGGGEQHVWEEDLYPWLAGEKEFIRKTLNSGRPVIGICFGAQLLAEVLGGRVFVGRYPEIGWQEVILTEDGRRSRVFRGFSDRFEGFHWHFDAFSLPEGCIRLASSTATPNQAFATHDGLAIGFQFHPEYTLDLVRYFVKRYGPLWPQGVFVADLQKLRARTEEYGPALPFFPQLLDNVFSRS